MTTQFTPGKLHPTNKLSKPSTEECAWIVVNARGEALGVVSTRSWFDARAEAVKAEAFGPSAKVLPMAKEIGEC